MIQNVFPFLKNEENVIDPDEVIGSIIKDEVENKMLSESGHHRYLEETLKMHIANVLTSMEGDTVLFETLLCSHPSRLRAVKNANGRHTDY